MIPVEIVVTFVIGYLAFRGFVAHVRLKAAHRRITELEQEKAELADALIRADSRPPLGRG